jgi:hypothetical protein
MVSARPGAHLSATLADLAGRVPAGDRTLRLHPALHGLADTVQRGSVIGCEGHAGVSMAMAVAAQPVADGAWVTVVGQPDLGAAAAVEAGIALQRLVRIDAHATSMDDRGVGDVLAAAVDGFDIVVIGQRMCRVSAGVARRLQARVQQRGNLLVVVQPQRSGVWSCDLSFSSGPSVWSGLDVGSGVARGRQVQVELAGRRVHRPRRAHVDWPLVAVSSDAVSSVAVSSNAVVDSSHMSTTRPQTAALMRVS